MKKLISILLLTVFCYSQTLQEEFINFEEYQRVSMEYIYEEAMEYDYGLTLVAIAWQESKLGKYMINLSDPSFGLFHIVPRGTKWEKSRQAEALMNFEYSLERAIGILDYWKKYHRGDWKKMVKSYNAGFAYNSKQADTYLKAIQAKVKFLKKELKK